MDTLGILVTPVIAAIVGLAVWFIQSRVDALRQAESRLRDERRKIYADLLEPYIRALSGSDDSRKSQKPFSAYELKKAAFELSGDTTADRCVLYDG